MEAFFFQFFYPFPLLLWTLRLPASDYFVIYFSSIGFKLQFQSRIFLCHCFGVHFSIKLVNALSFPNAEKNNSSIHLLPNVIVLYYAFYIGGFLKLCCWKWFYFHTLLEAFLLYNSLQSVGRIHN